MSRSYTIAEGMDECTKTTFTQKHAPLRPTGRSITSSPYFDLEARICFNFFDDFVIAIHFSDIAVHHMGTTLATTGPDEFRSAPLWAC